MQQQCATLVASHVSSVAAMFIFKNATELFEKIIGRNKSKYGQTIILINFIFVAIESKLHQTKSLLLAYL